MRFNTEARVIKKKKYRRQELKRILSFFKFELMRRMVINRVNTFLLVEEAVNK